MQYLGATTRRFSFGGIGGPLAKDLRLTGIESLAVAEVEPLGAELTRSGRRIFACGGVVANAVAPVADVPTTAPSYVLQNKNTDSKRLIIDRVAVRFASGTAAVGMAVLLGISSVAQAAVASTTGVTLVKANDGSLYTRASLATGITLTGAPNGYMQFGANFQPATATSAGQGSVFDVQGRICVPPNNFCLGIHILSAVGTTAKYTVDVDFYESEFDVE